MTEVGSGAVSSGRRRPFALSDVEQERLSGLLQEAVKRARRSGEQTLATISLALPADVDPTAVA